MRNAGLPTSRPPAPGPVLDLEAPHGSGTNRVERFGLELLKRHVRRGGGRLHRWTDEDRGEIWKVQRGAVGWAAFAGALSGAVIGGAEIGFREPLLDGADGWREQLPYWLTYLGVAAVVSLIEVVALYWMMLLRVGRISAIAGLGIGSQDIEQVMAVGLSRAALEMPNPRSPVYGIDPYARVPRWKLLAYTVLYRLKIGATSFILRILLRRIMARAAVRTFIPLIAIPVFAVWNAVVTAWVMREAQLRAAGPLAVKQLGDWLADHEPKLTRDTQQLVFDVVGESIIRARDAHPNFVLLLTRLFREFDVEPDDVAVEWDAVRRRLEDTEPAQRQAVLVVAVAALVLNGRVRRHQTALVEELHDTCGAHIDRDLLKSMRRGLLRGEGLPIADLARRCAG
jgi:hypothetical protein